MVEVGRVMVVGGIAVRVVVVVVGGMELLALAARQMVFQSSNPGRELCLRVGEVRTNQLDMFLLSPMLLVMHIPLLLLLLLLLV